MSDTLDLPLSQSGVTQQQFRDAMASMGSAVNIITTDGPAGRAGFTASAVCSVTDTPPTLLVCLNRSASVYPIFQQHNTLCINTLAAEHSALSQLFGGKSAMESRFAAAEWSSLVTGSPVLAGAIASFDCQISQVVSVGSHDILFCQVLALSLDNSQHGLAYFDRQYHSLLRQGA